MTVNTEKYSMLKHDLLKPVIYSFILFCSASASANSTQINDATTVINPLMLLLIGTCILATALYMRSNLGLRMRMKSKSKSPSSEKSANTYDVLNESSV
jgi:hypothetical protein